MANPKISQNVEITCKSTFKSTVKLRAKLCVNYKKFIQPVEIFTFSPRFTNFPTIFLTTLPHLKTHPLFHFFTDPTITIINKLEERN